MNEINFITKIFADRFEHHLPSSSIGFLKTSIFDGGFLLDEPAKQAFYTFLYNNGVSWFASHENSLLYYSILNELSKNNTCYLIYLGSATDIKLLHPDLQATKCEWRYSIEYTEGNERCTQFGFQNPAEFLDAVNYSNKDLTDRYFYLAEIDQRYLINYVNLYSSDVTNWCFAFCSAQNSKTLVSLFTDATQRPSLSTVLAYVNSLVNIQIGGDEGYLDYVLIQSKDSIDTVNLEQTMNSYATQYTTLLQEVSPMDDEWKVDFYKERFIDIFQTRQF